ncbi:MAG: dUTP pyrophosphatase [Candidatus Epulonipiscioides saccharophilum]|nr:MAG: dUTP pyrophosphatase [Epulopiscium sp. AS2M-Bin001]
MNEQTIYFAKLKEEAKIPAKRPEDAGYDIYACFEEEFILIYPNETKLIPTGIVSAFSPNYVAIIKERGSTGSRGIGQRAGIIDSGYRGEWFIAITNHNNKPLVISKKYDSHTNVIPMDVAIIYPYDKAIAQCLFLELPKMDVCEITYEKILSIESERGDGKIGSTKK